MIDIINKENYDIAIVAINIDILSKSGIKPRLEQDKEYKLLNECVCKCGQIHYDIGLKSIYNFVSCYMCGQELPKSDTIHWANSIRFINKV